MKEVNDMENNESKIIAGRISAFGTYAGVIGACAGVAAFIFGIPERDSLLMVGGGLLLIIALLQACLMHGFACCVSALGEIRDSLTGVGIQADDRPF